MRDRTLDELRALTERAPHMSEDEASDAIALAARQFTGCTLHRRRPVEKQGNTDARAWVIRDAWGEAAAKLWLAVSARLDELSRLNRGRR